MGGLIGGTSLLQSLLVFLIDGFFWIIGIIGSLIIYPVQVLLVTLVPGLGDFLSVVLTFITEYIFPMISFAKECVLDISCCPRNLFYILVTFIIARWGLAPAIRSIKLGLNLWKVVQGGSTKE